MSELIVFELEDESLVYFESSKIDFEEGEEEAFSQDGGRKKFKEVLKNIKPTIEETISTLSQLATKPDQLEFEFALSLKSKAGAVFAQIGAEANIKVKMTWNKND